MVNLDWLSSLAQLRNGCVAATATAAVRSRLSTLNRNDVTPELGKLAMWLLKPSSTKDIKQNMAGTSKVEEDSIEM
jgi:hypothetical protein